MEGKAEEENGREQFKPYVQLGQLKSIEHLFSTGHLYFNPHAIW